MVKGMTGPDYAEFLYVEWGLTPQLIDDRVGSSRYSFSIPQISPHINALADAIVDRCQFPAVVHSYGWDIWGSSECPKVVELVRSGLGIRENLMDVPSVYFEGADRESLLAYIIVQLQNSWDFHLLESCGSRIWNFTNDECADIFCSTREQELEIEQLFKIYEVPLKTR